MNTCMRDMHMYAHTCIYIYTYVYIYTHKIKLMFFEVWPTFQCGCNIHVYKGMSAGPIAGYVFSKDSEG